MESILNIVNNKNKIKRFLFVILGVFIAAVSFNLFIFPNDIVFGGLTGVSVIITNFIDLDPSLIIFVLSFILLLIGAIFLGREPVIKAFVVAIVFPIFVSVSSYNTVENFTAFPASCTGFVPVCFLPCSVI